MGYDTQVTVKACGPLFKFSGQFMHTSDLRGRLSTGPNFPNFPPFLEVALIFLIFC
jgi:hypothetical protein